MPDPNGSLEEIVPSTSIAMANREVKSLRKMLALLVPTNAEVPEFHWEGKAKIAKWASEMGVTSSIRCFAKNEFISHPLKERTVRTWMNHYKRQLKLKDCVGVK